MEKKKRGNKSAEPKAEELEFIYQRIDRLSDQEILDQMQEEDFQLRSTGFIKRRRKEYTAAKKILENTLNQEIEPSIVKAIDNHHSEIHSLIEKWLDAFPDHWPLLQEFKDNDRFIWRVWPWADKKITISELNSVCSDTLFSCLREHLPSENFWNCYSDWEATAIDYVRLCNEIIEEIRKEGATWSDEIKLRDNFEDPILSVIQTHSIDPEPEKLLFKPRGRDLWCSTIHPNFDESREIILLETEKPEDYISRYEQLSIKWLGSSQVTALVSLQDKLGKQIQEIHHFLQEALIAGRNADKLSHSPLRN